MNTLRPVLLLAPLTELSTPKTFDSIDYSQAPARADSFAQTLQGATERSQEHASPNKFNGAPSTGERLPSSGKGGSRVPVQRTPARAEDPRPTSTTPARPAKTKAATKNAKQITAVEDNPASGAHAAPPPALSLLSQAPVQTAPAQHAGTKDVPSTQIALAGASAPQMTTTASHAAASPGAQNGIGIPANEPEIRAGVSASGSAPAQSQAVPTMPSTTANDIAANSYALTAGAATPVAVPSQPVSPSAPSAVADSLVAATAGATPPQAVSPAAPSVPAASVGATPVDTPPQALSLAAPSIAAANSVVAVLPRPAVVAKPGAHTSLSQTAAANSTASAGATSDAGAALSPANTAVQTDAQGASSGNPPTPVANPTALDQGAPAAAAIPGLQPVSGAPPGNPVGIPIGIPVGNPVAGPVGVAALGASAARAATAAAQMGEQGPGSSSAGAPQNAPDGSSFGAVQALVNGSSGAGAGANSTGTGAAAAPALTVSQPVESQEFGHGVANQVSVMMDNQLNVAKLQVNPASLGPIEVRIALQAGHAQVWMTSHSAVTRDALQGSASHLRDLLGQQGFGQVSVDISHRQFQERAPQSFTYERNSASDASVAAAPPQPAATSTLRRGDGKLDAYA